MKTHSDKSKMDSLFPAIREYQALAQSHGISDIFQDNGGKLLQLLVELNLKVVPGRTGSDAIDANGREYEIKTMNLNLTASFSTHHHLNTTILAHFRTMDWLFAFYRGIELSAVYQLTPVQLEPMFSKWEQKLIAENRIDLNNPKIPSRFVCDTGTLLYGIRPQQGIPKKKLP